MVSVIVPIYKVEKYLDECVQSVLHQTDPNFELILVDDGSPDNCPAMCDAFAEQDSRVRVIHKANGGLSDARNAGLEVAKGDYVMFLDSDDALATHYIEKMLGRLVADGSQMAVCGFQTLGADTEPTGLQDEVINKQTLFERSCGERYGSYISVCNKLFCRKVWEGVRFPKGKLNEDLFVNRYIADRCETVSCVAEGMYFYRSNAAGISQSYKPARLDEVEAFAAQFAFFLKKKNILCAALALNMVPNAFVLIYNGLDKSQPEAQKRIKESLKLYRRCFLKIVCKKIPLGKKLHMALFFFGPKVYLKLIPLVGKFA